MQEFSNMAYQYNDPLEYDPQGDFDHDWVHVGCIKSIFPHGSLMLNLENSSFSKAWTPFDNPDSSNQAHVLSMTMDKLYVAEHVPSSYSSSNDGSTQGLDGSPLTQWDIASIIMNKAVETVIFTAPPDIADSVNKYAPLAPTTGLRKIRHFRRASLPRLYPMSSFTDKLHAANIDHYLVDHEIQDNKGIHLTDLQEVYSTHRRKGSSQTDKSRPAECLILMTAFDLAIIIFRVISSYLVSNKYGVLRTRLQNR